MVPNVTSQNHRDSRICRPYNQPKDNHRVAAAAFKRALSNDAGGHVLTGVHTNHLAFYQMAL
jgi:hypothetical protein